MFSNPFARRALRLALGALVLWTGAALYQGVAHSEEDEPPPGGTLPPEVLERITPGPQHRHMGWYLGEWTTATHMTMPGMPAAPPSKGTCTYSWLIEGRWMMSRMKGSLMGMPMEWVHVHGYNNMTKSYETIGFDSMSTDAKIAYGNAVTPDGKTFAFQGMMNEFLTGQIKKPFRTVITERDDDHFDIGIWDPEIGPNGAEVLRIEFTRVK